MEGMAFVGLYAGNTRKFRTVERAIRHHDEARLHPVAAVGGDDPAPDGFVPAHLSDFGLKADIAIEIELLADRAAVLQDLRSARIFLDRHVADLFEQRQINIGLDIARRARIAVPIPGAAKVAALLDQAD